MEDRFKTCTESARFCVSHVSELLGLSPEERSIVEFRVALIKRLIRQRQRSELTQRSLAKKMGSSQPRVALMEAGHSAVSIELVMRGLFAAGGNWNDIASAAREAKSLLKRPHSNRAKAKRKVPMEA